MIELQQVSKIYPTKRGPVLALDDINLKVKPGEIFGVIGKSGAGKSSLIRCVNLLERPTSGEVIVDGQILNQLSAKALRFARHQIGMIFQHFNLLTTRTAYQNIAFPLELQGFSKKEIDKTVQPLIEFTGLEKQKNNYPSQLSGGQKQRVAIARALATKPKVLLCDEMTSALDPETTHSILKLVKAINEQMQLSILLITHEMDVIKKIADQVAVIDQGKIIEKTDVLSLFKNPQHPVTQTLIQSTLKLDLPKEFAEKLHVQSQPDDKAIIRLSFIGKIAAEPIVNDVIKKFAVQVNILQANLELLKTETIGVMLIALTGADIEKKNAIQYLEERGLKIEVIGYVRSHDWFIH